MEDRDFKWWDADESELHEKLDSMVSSVQQNQEYRKQLNLHHMRLYADRELYGAGGAGARYDRRNSAANILRQRRPRLSLNVVRNMINASTSMLTRTRPAPQFMTRGGDWELQKRAKQRGHFVEAVFHQEKSYLLGQKMVQHGGIMGTGAIKVLRDYETKRVRHESAFPGELYVDEAEAIYGSPRNLFQVRSMDRLVLKEMYGKEEAVDKATPAPVAGVSRGGVANGVLVIEAWHLPSGPNAGDGRYAVITDAGTLFNEPYEHEDFPFCFWRWEDDPLGFWGTGIASELTGIQYEINETIRNMQANWWSGGNLKVLVERGSKVVKSHLSNDLRGVIVEYTGTPPSWITTNAVNPGLMEYLRLLLEQAYQVTGISQLNATSQTPAASMSGRARLIADQNESQRFLTAQRRYEQAFMRLAEATLEAAEDIHDRVGDFEVIHAGKDYLQPIKYSEIAASPGTYEIQIYPTSILPSTPVGRMSMVEALEARGYINKSQAVKLLDFPDVDQELDLETAMIDLIDERIQKILDDGEYIGPHPDFDLQMTLDRSLKALAMAENRGAPDAVLEQLRKFRTATIDLLRKQQPPTPPPGPPGPGGGGGAPLAGPGQPMAAQPPPQPADLAQTPDIQAA